MMPSNGAGASLRGRMYRSLANKIPQSDRDDVVQGAYERALSQGQENNVAYLWRTLHSVISDYHRERNKATVEHAKLLSKAPELEGCLRLVPKREDRLLLERLAPWREGTSNQSLREIAHELGQSYTALRQRRSRTMRAIQVELLAKWYREANLQRLNDYRLPATLMAAVMRRLTDEGVADEVFRRLFKKPELSPAIQNSIWALASSRDSTVVSFFKQQLTKDDFFRGTKTYLADALLGYVDAEVDKFVNHHYFGGLGDMRSRRLNHKESVPVGTPTIFDVRKVRIIGRQRSIDTDRIKSGFLQEEDVDLHRASAFALLRIAPDDNQIGGLVVRQLSQEWDETNAYYVTKFLMKVGLPRFPEVYGNEATRKAAHAVARKWPGNSYLRDSAARISVRLKN